MSEEAVVLAAIGSLWGAVLLYLLWLTKGTRRS